MRHVSPSEPQPHPLDSLRRVAPSDFVHFGCQAHRSAHLPVRSADAKEALLMRLPSASVLRTSDSETFPAPPRSQNIPPASASFFCFPFPAFCESVPAKEYFLHPSDYPAIQTAETDTRSVFPDTLPAEHPYTFRYPVLSEESYLV